MALKFINRCRFSLSLKYKRRYMLYKRRSPRGELDVFPFFINSYLLDKHRSQRGFTLIETVVSLLILGLLTTAILGLYQYSVVTWREEERTIEVQDNLRTGLDRMTRELREAKGLHAESNGEILKFYNSSGEVITYFLEGTNLYRKKGSDVKQPVAGHITELDFTYRPEGVDITGRSLVEIVIKGEMDGTGEITLKTTVRIRVMSG